MYHEYAEEGEVTEKERRRLDKFAVAIGISEERVKEIKITRGPVPCHLMDKL